MRPDRLLTTLRLMILNRLQLRLDARGDAPTPPADAWHIYVRSSDSALVAKSPAGAVTDLTAGGGGGAPTTADYLVRTADAGLSAERVVTDTASIVTDWGTAGQAKLNVQFGSSGSVACVGNDARLTDARTPTAHVSSHLDGGSDALLDTSRTNSKGIQLSSVGLVGVDMMAIAGAYHYAFADYAGNTQYSHGWASLSALGTSGTSGTLHNRRTGTASTGVQQSSRLHLLSYGAVMCLRFKIPTAINARRILIGISSANPTDTDTVNGSYIGWMYSSVRGDAGWMPCSRDGVTQTLGAAGSALAADVEYMAVIRHDKGGSTVYLEMHNLTAGTVSTATVTATLPATSTALGALLVAYNQGVDKGFDVLSLRCWTET